MLSVQEAHAEGPTMEIKITKETLEDEKSFSTKEIDNETMNKMAYQHMLDRLKKDYTSSKIATGELETSLRSKQAILDLEMLKFRKTKESKL